MERGVTLEVALQIVFQNRRILEYQPSFLVNTGEYYRMILKCAPCLIGFGNTLALLVGLGYIQARRVSLTCYCITFVHESVH